MTIQSRIEELVKAEISRVEGVLGYSEFDSKRPDALSALHWMLGAIKEVLAKPLSEEELEKVMIAIHGHKETWHKVKDALHLRRHYAPIAQAAHRAVVGGG